MFSVGLALLLSLFMIYAVMQDALILSSSVQHLNLSTLVDIVNHLSDNLADQYTIVVCHGFMYKWTII